MLEGHLLHVCASTNPAPCSPGRCLSVPGSKSCHSTSGIPILLERKVLKGNLLTSSARWPSSISLWGWSVITSSPSRWCSWTSSSPTPTGSWRWKVRRVFSMEQLLKYTQDQVLIFLKAFWSRTLIKLYYDNEQPDFSKLKSVWSTISLAPCPSVGCWRGWRCSSTSWPSYSPCLIERWALEMSDLGPGPTSWPSSPCPTRTSHCSRTLSRVEVIPIRILPLEIAGLQFCTQSFSSQGALPLLPPEGCEELVLLDHVDLIFTYGGMFPWNSSNEEMWLHLAHVPHDPGNPLTKTTVRKLLLLQAG